MKWSSTLTSTSASASFSLRVSSSSAWLGWATPDGWLWAKITAAALCAQAGLDDFARVDAGLRQRAAEQLLAREHAVLRVEQQADEDFVLAVGERQRR